MRKVNYAGWPNCVRLSNGTVELIATTDVGPRVIRFGFVGGPNLFKEYTEQAGLVGGPGWRIYGGHRLWHAPEVKPRTYEPDNDPVAWAYRGGTLTLAQRVEPGTGIQKSMKIRLHPRLSDVTVRHVLTNRGMFAVELAPWALSVMAPGGRAIFPHEPYRAHTDYLLPARPVVLWHYTDMSDKRWTWGKRFIQLRQNPKLPGTPQKIGLANFRGWAAYTLGDNLFIKRFEYQRGATYPDMGCNCETFTNESMLEVETLGPLTRLEPGRSVAHVERWSLHRGRVGTSEAAIERALTRAGAALGPA